jgi:pimeloyl-ACP methyl ester carboxylesterase
MKVAAGLEYEQRGSGTAVVLVHAGVFSAWFSPLFGCTALDGFRVVRPVRPGYGRLPRPADPWRPADGAGRCAALARELGIRRAYWVGHSSSCGIVLQLGLDHADLVQGLVLFEPARPSGPLQVANSPRYVGPALAAAARGDTVTAFDTFLSGVGGAGHRRTMEARLGAAGIAEAVRESEYFFADELPGVWQWAFGPEQAAAVRAPVLIVTGTASRPWFAENGDLLAGMLPDARQVSLPGADHLGPLTHADDLAVIISGFVH